MYICSLSLSLSISLDSPKSVGSKPREMAATGDSACIHTHTRTNTTFVGPYLSD